MDAAYYEDLAGRDQQQGSSIRADAMQSEQAGGSGSDERGDELV